MQHNDDVSEQKPFFYSLEDKKEMITIVRLNYQPAAPTVGCHGVSG